MDNQHPRLDSLAVGLSEPTGFSLSDTRRAHREFDLATWQDRGNDLTRYCYLRMTEFFPHALIQRVGAVAALRSDPVPEILEVAARAPDGMRTLRDFQDAAPVDGFIVAHQGRIAYESYPRMGGGDRHIWWSVSKTLASALVASLEDDGMVDTRQPIDNYLPELTSSGWEGIMVQDILDMASGINCLESDDPTAYTNAAAPFFQYEATLGMLPSTRRTPISTYDYIAGLTRLRAPGQVFQYTSANTFVLGWLAERMRQRPFAALVYDELWRHIGAEADAMVVLSSAGAPASHGGVSSRLRDLVRYGLLYTPSWATVSRQQAISPAYIKKIQTGGRPEIFAKGADHDRWIDILGEQPRHNTYMWDLVMEDGDFFKAGFNGQGLWISPSRDLVIAFFGHGGKADAAVRFARAIAVSGLFPKPKG